MSALEAVISAGGEAELGPLFSYDLNPASTAVVARKQGCRAYPTSASTLTPTGTKTVRIRMGGNDFVNPASCRIVTHFAIPAPLPYYAQQSVLMGPLASYDFSVLASKRIFSQPTTVVMNCMVGVS